jgi:hypothetical protein
MRTISVVVLGALLVLGAWGCADEGDDERGGEGGATGTGGSGAETGGRATGGEPGGTDSGGGDGGGSDSGGGDSGGSDSGGNDSGGSDSGGSSSSGGRNDSGGSGGNGGGSATGGADSGVGGAGGSSASGGTGPGGGGAGGDPNPTGGASAGGANPTGGGPGTGGTDWQSGPPAGNPDGACAVPAEAQAEDTSSADVVVGTGSAASCNADAFIDAVAQGGIITFDCGPDPVTITLDRPAKVFNDTGPEIVIDGGGLVTLSGGGTTRILYMNTCDENQVWTTDHCQDQDHPRLTVQNLTFVDGNSQNETEYDGGGAIWVRGGRFKVVNSRFFNNVCADDGPDVGGAGIRVFSQYQGEPVYVVNSTFGGAEGYGNTCSNGGGVSSIGVSWTIINSLFTHNDAIGCCGNPADSGTPGGGSGGAIYNDGNEMTLRICGTRIEDNTVQAYGSAIFFVSNNHTGEIFIDDSVITNNTGGSWEPAYPQLSHHDDTPVTVSNSTIEQ